MNDYTTHEQPEEENRTVKDTAVVFAIPKRAARLGAVLVGLVVVGVVATLLVYRLLDARAADDGGSPPDDAPPPSGTSVPSNVEQPAPIERFAVSPDDDPAVGPEDAPVVIIEFSDYQCYYCGLFARETLHPLLNLYGDQIRFVYRDFVFYGPVSLQAAISAECAAEQGAFWPYHDRLFEQQNNLNAELFFALAKELDLDMQAFARCVDDPAVAGEVKADTADGQALGVRGTPTFYINGRVLVGAQPLNAFADIVDEELALAGATPLQDVQSDP